MVYLSLLRKEDLKKLTNDDVKKIEEVTPSLKSIKSGKKEWIGDNIEFLEAEAKEIVKEKVFAGQISIKLYKVNTILTSEEIKSKLESEEFKFNKQDIISESDIMKKIISVYSTFILENDDYVIRLQYYNGNKTYLGHTFKDIKYIEVIYHIKSNVIEVRTDVKKAKKIVDFLNRKLNLGSIDGIRILKKHGTIEEFAKSIDGHFKKISSATAMDISQLNSNDIATLGDLVLALDDYLINKDSEEFVEKLKNMHFENNELTFTETFLAGCKEIGITVDTDLSNQGLYKVLCKYLSNENGYISLKCDDSEDVTIRVSTKIDTNTIQFVSSANEKVIRLVVDNIYDGISNRATSKDEINELYKEIEKFIRTVTIKSFRPEYLIKNFKLSQEVVLNILDTYVKNGVFTIRFEMISRLDGEIIKEFESIDDIRKNEEFMKSMYDEDYEIIESNEKFVDEYNEYINIVYYINEEKRNNLEDENQGENICSMLEKELNGNSKEKEPAEKAKGSGIFVRILEKLPIRHVIVEER
ncbi:hypothetical protein AB2T96_17955 [Clostridium butyricum]|uniref:hypothetical protein n=1 Tax=Clostridium butyricum TaxID=1492 RepID=UPI0034652234